VVELASVSEEVDIDGTWIFDYQQATQRILTHEEEMTNAERRKMALMTQADQAMMPLQYALELGRAT